MHDPVSTLSDSGISKAPFDCRKTDAYERRISRGFSPAMVRPFVDFKKIVRNLEATTSPTAIKRQFETLGSRSLRDHRSTSTMGLDEMRNPIWKGK